jgi:tRNA(Ile)-lysidine synthase
LTVDHHLRPESTREAQWVHDHLTERGLDHYILQWDHSNEGKPQTRIQEVARFKRYALLNDWCAEKGLSLLMTAHHRHDQIETFFMRLFHGSGLKGLAAIQPIKHPAPQHPNVTLVRPLLSVSKQDLIHTLDRFGASYITDPSNVNPVFERVRIRSLLGTCPDYALDVDTVHKSIAKLQEIDAFIERCVQKFISSQEQDSFSHAAFIEQDPYLQRRILLRYITVHGYYVYQPTDSSLDQACAKLTSPAFEGLTIGHAYFKRRAGGRIFVSSENRQILQTIA